MPRRRAPDFLAQLRDSAIRDFRRSLCREYVEVGANCYDQQQALAHMPHMSWRAGQTIEQRMGLSIKGLCIDKGDGQAAADAMLADAGPGELHILARSLLRIGDMVRLARAVSVALAGEQGGALALALASERRAELGSKILPLVLAAGPAAIGCVAHVAGLTDVVSLKWLDRQLQSSPPVQVLWAAGRVSKGRVLAPALARQCQAQSSAPQAAARALARLDPSGCRALVARFNDADALPLHAILCDRKGAEALSHQLASNPPDTSSCFALALLGKAPSVEVLLHWLTNPTIADAAARALHLVTGFSPCTDVFVADEMADDELFAEELERKQRGEAMLAGRGPFGTSKRVLSTDPHVWRRLWQASPARQATRRIRLGQPWAGQSAVASLASPHLPRGWREWIDDEIVARFGARSTFSVELAIEAQQAALEELWGLVSVRSADEWAVAP